SDIGALTYNKQSIDIAALLKACIQSFHVKAQDAGLTVDDLVQAVPVVVSGDPARLEQLFSNLLENAIRYTDSGGRIEVTLTQQNHKVFIRIQDAAPGVPEDQQDRIFERLFRLESSRNRSTGGAGLGLSICKNIVTAHQGAIVAYASPLGGLGIQITLAVA